MTLVDRLEAVVARLEELEAQRRPRSIMAELLFDGYGGASVIRVDGSVEHHWDHPSFQLPRRHSLDDGCTVYPTVEEWQEAMRALSKMAFG